MNDDNVSLNFSEMHSKAELKEYLFDSAKCMQGVNYLTTYTKLKYFLQTMSTKKWRIGSPSRMNDRRELASFPYADWDRIYYSCFMADCPESIAMWSLYGRPWADAISIRIDQKNFLKWIYETKKIYIKDDNQEYHEFDDGILRVTRVAYTNEQTREPNQKLELKCGTGINSYINDIFADYSIRDFAGTIKDAAWAYENEIRVRIDCKEGFESISELYIDIPDYVIENMVITAGPLFFGNLECRLGGYSNDVLALKYSDFTGLLDGMPCYNYKGSSGALCQESMALNTGKSQIVGAYNLVLFQRTGKGVFRFDTKGEISIGSGEYSFFITWKRFGDKIIIENEIGVLHGMKTLPSSNMIHMLSSFERDLKIENECVFVCRNTNNRVLAINLSKADCGVGTYYMEYKVFDNISLNLYDNKLNVERPNEFEALPHDKDDFLCGTWWDENSQRCHLEIRKKDLIYFVQVNWASSYCINSKWTFSGLWDEKNNRMIYSNETSTEEHWYENGSVGVLTKHTDGTGKISLVDDTLLWEDFMGTTGCSCIFKKQSYQAN